MLKFGSRKTILVLCVFCGAAAMSSPAQTFTTLVNFDETNGAYPAAAPIQGLNGNLYGTAQVGGNLACGTGIGCGTVFEMTPEGTLTTLYSFCTQTDCVDGSQPTAGLFEANNGTFYGTTILGGASSNCPGGCGTVFKITAEGTLSTVHSFDLTDGAEPSVGLVQAANGSFYGTTSEGGASDVCDFVNVGCGTVFKMNPEGTLTRLYSFCDQGNDTCPDGSSPQGALVQASNGNLYGTTVFGGSGYGTVFEITPEGALTLLYSFSSSAGSDPRAGLFQATNGKFYGTTYYGGADSLGTVFSLVPKKPLGPFVETIPTSGKAGTNVTILGNSLKGSTSVTFNGTPASLTVKSNTAITTTVPSGATTGSVEVTTASGTILTSNVKFRVP